MMRVMLLVAALVGAVFGGCSRAGPAPETKATEGGEVVDRQIAAHVGEKLGVSAADVIVEVMKDAGVPGVVVFTARVPAEKKGRPPRHLYGVVAGGEVVTERDAAMKRVLDAWDYGPKRAVPPAAVARVFGVLQGASRDPTAALVTEGELTSVAAELQSGLFPPREIEVEGQPAVEYWVTASEVPLRRTTAVIGPDRAVKLSVEEKWQ